jgi:hypothetical protein
LDEDEKEQEMVDAREMLSTELGIEVADSEEEGYY